MHALWTNRMGTGCFFKNQSYTNLYGDTMYKYTQRINVSMEYDVGESTSLREMLMNPCKWRQDAYSEDQSNGPILRGEQGACTKGSVPCGQVVYICVLLNIVSEQQSCVWGGGVAERRREGSALLHD